MNNIERSNIFGVVLTGVAPASNYRGEKEGNHTPLQKLRFPNGKDYTIFSAESIRNRLREMLRGSDFLSNRSRLFDRDQLAVKFEEANNPKKYADDKLFGFLNLDAEKQATKKGQSSEFKQPKQGDSVLRVNYAVSIEPFESDDETMHQSPEIFVKDKHIRSSAIIQRQVHVTAYQYPFGLNLKDLKLPAEDIKDDKDGRARKEERATIEENWRGWTAKLLLTICELNGVGGNHARTMFPFSPVSIVLRLTERRTPDFDLYGFKPEKGESQRALIDAIEDGRLPGDQFYIGGDLMRQDEKLKSLLAANGEQVDTRTSKSGDKKGKGLQAVNAFKTPTEAMEALLRDAGLPFPKERK
jgi:CRISPR-associated protein Cst2